MKKKLPEGNFLSDEGSDFTTSQVPRQSSQQQCARRRHGPEVHKHTRKGYFFFSFTVYGAGFDGPRSGSLSPQTGSQDGALPAT